MISGSTKLVLRIAVGVEEAEGQRVEFRVGKATAKRFELILRQLNEDAAVGRDTLGHFKAQMAWHQWLWLVPCQVKHAGRAQAPDLKHVAETCRGQQADTASALLQDGVGTDRCSVQHGRDVARAKAGLGKQLRYTLPEPLLPAGCGVEETFLAKRRPSSATRTRSVNVPPISTPMRAVTGMLLAF